MRAGPRFAAVALTAALQSAPAFAQALPCLECRALIEFGDCDSAATPPKGSISVVGAVVRVERMQCGTVGLTVDVKRSSLSLLPTRIKIGVGQCLVWAEKQATISVRWWSKRRPRTAPIRRGHVTRA
jgi:hypothetical protein